MEYVLRQLVQMSYGDLLYVSFGNQKSTVSLSKAARWCAKYPISCLKNLMNFYFWLLEILRKTKNPLVYGQRENSLAHQNACGIFWIFTLENIAFFNCMPVGQTSDSMTVPTERLICGAWCIVFVQAHPDGLTVWFIFLQYLVACTAEYLSVFYPFYILICMY